MLFRKKPVVIEAVQYIPPATQLTGGFLKDCDCWINSEGALVIHTLEGDHIANPNDWIIRGVKGEFYPCKPDIFEQTYELVI